MKTSPEDIEKWRTVPREGHHLEFKEAKNSYDDDKMFRYCAALANEGGGKFVLGMTDRPPRRIVGSQAYHNTGATEKHILDKLHFRVDIEEVGHPEGRLLVFHIPPRPVGTPYRCGEGFPMRVGESLEWMTESQLRVIFSEGQPQWSQEVARAGVDGAEVDRLLDTHIYFDLRLRPYPSTRASALETLASKGFITKVGGRWNILNMGAILFARKLSDFSHLERKAARVVVYEGTGKLRTLYDSATDDDQPFNRGYAGVFQPLIASVNGRLPSHEGIEFDLRVKTQQFPPITIRELIANALVHQDFREGGTSVKIEIYTDRMEIVNPGTPIIPIERFIGENKSRNEALAKAMRDMRICEEQGSGWEKIVTAVENRQLPSPEIRTGHLHTSIVLFGPKDFSEMSKAERVRACYQHCCLRFVTNRKMTNQTLRDRFGLPDTNAKTAAMWQVISEAVSQGQIKPVEGDSTSRRYARYVPFWG